MAARFSPACGPASPQRERHGRARGEQRPVLGYPRHNGRRAADQRPEVRDSPEARPGTREQRHAERHRRQRAGGDPERRRAQPPVAGERADRRIEEHGVGDQRGGGKVAGVASPAEAQALARGPAHPQPGALDDEEESEQPGGAIDRREEEPVVDNSGPHPHRGEAQRRQPVQPLILVKKSHCSSAAGWKAGAPRDIRTRSPAPGRAAPLTADMSVFPSARAPRIVEFARGDGGEDGKQLILPER